MDDNCHPALSLRLVDAFIRADADFEMLMVPNAAHSYLHAEAHVLRRQWDFLTWHLIGAEPSAGYRIDPAGASLAMRAGDLLAFARAHMRGDPAVLPASTARLMREPQVALPDLGRPGHWGLGWELPRWTGGTVAGHDGSTPGQAATLRLVPDAGVAVALPIDVPRYAGRYVSDVMAWRWPGTRPDGCG
ncbi:serine hydrolase [Microtetraspora malaysiensis]|uniref:Serine hydrolase n=1 Tax=Microtetraspora malaysiensis TaxID=161358 RepID=A0ABW6T068_9ACTN